MEKALTAVDTGWRCCWNTTATSSSNWAIPQVHWSSGKKRRPLAAASRLLDRKISEGARVE